VAVLGHRHDGVTAQLGVFVVADLVKLEPVHGNCHLALVVLHGGHEGLHVIDHALQLDELLVRGLGLWWLGRSHGGTRVGKGGIRVAVVLVARRQRWWRGCETTAATGGSDTKMI
jgi:hypothetical protein